MLHGRGVILWNHIRNVEDEEVFLRVSIGEQSHDESHNSDSRYQEPKIRAIRNRSAFAPFGTQIRAFRNPDSRLSEPRGPFGLYEEGLCGIRNTTP